MAIDANARISQGEKIVFQLDLGFYPTDLGICSIKCFTVDLGTLATFDGTDPKVGRVKPKVRNTIFSPVYILAKPFNRRYANQIVRTTNTLFNAPRG